MQTAKRSGKICARHGAFKPPGSERGLFPEEVFYAMVKETDNFMPFMLGIDLYRRAGRHRGGITDRAPKYTRDIHYFPNRAERCNAPKNLGLSYLSLKSGVKQSAMLMNLE
jgi:hypothetical protein